MQKVKNVEKYDREKYPRKYVVTELERIKDLVFCLLDLGMYGEGKKELKEIGGIIEEVVSCDISRVTLIQIFKYLYGHRQY